MLRSNTRPWLRLATVGLALCGGLAVASLALAATSAAAARLAAATQNASSATFVVGSTDRSTR